MRGDRLTEQETLHFGTTFGRDLVELFSGFDAFGRGHHAHSACERRDRPHDIERARVFRNVLYERAVDLDLVERKALEIGKRGISGAKIVHRDPDTKGSQLVKHGKCRVLVVQQDGLGNFDLQPCRVQARGSERPNDDLHQAWTRHGWRSKLPRPSCCTTRTRHLPCFTSCEPLVSGSRWTILAPDIPRLPISSAFRSTRSRSTARS